MVIEERCKNIKKEIVNKFLKRTKIKKIKTIKKIRLDFLK
jgi:hypothetical protein